MPRPSIVCVTPVRNEAWIIERFLRAASQWADQIIVADQGSTDDTVAIARRFAKAKVITNDSDAYDEVGRQRLLLAAAREVPGPRIVVALDADEFLTPNWSDSPEWAAVLVAPPGTVVRFDWVNLLPCGERAWIPPQKFAYAFVDDGSSHSGDRIHSTRVPQPAGAPVLDLADLKVLHLQYTDWPRMESKQRWYQCWELLNSRGKRPIQIYRQYHRMHAFPTDEVRPIDRNWLTAYGALGIDLRPKPSEGPFWWDEDVLDWLIAHGAGEFARIDLWDVDWDGLARQLRPSLDLPRLSDPRSPLERFTHSWLRRTQPRAHTPLTRWGQRVLAAFGW